MNDILNWMETSLVGEMMRNSVWLFPSAEIFHFIGLCLLIGALMVADLCLLGVIKNMTFSALDKFLSLSVFGFAINMTTGILFCFSDPFRYYPNIAFRIKMLLIIAAGLNAIWFKFSIYPKLGKLSMTVETSAVAKIIAILSLLIWFSVIVLGRMIPYVEE